MKAFHNPANRLVAASAALVLTALAVRRDRVSSTEERAFRAVNNLPDVIFGPLWLLMQCGNAGAPLAAALAALVRRDRRLAARLFVVGTTTWALSKVVKQRVRRPRPAVLLAATRRRGAEPAGLGYLSGHAGVVVALGAAALPRLQARGRAGVLLLAPVVGIARVYVGAHLPLDVVGGAALGLGVEAMVSMLDRARPARRRHAACNPAPHRLADVARPCSGGPAGLPRLR